MFMCSPPFFCLYSILGSVQQKALGWPFGARKSVFCRPCGHTAGFKTSSWAEKSVKEAKKSSWVGNGGGRRRVKVGPHVSHRGVPQRWRGSHRGASLSSACSVLPALSMRYNWLARVHALPGCFLLGQEPKMLEYTMLLFTCAGLYSLEHRGDLF